MGKKLGVVVLDPMCLPEQHGDWIDLKCSTKVFIEKGEYMEIPLGVKIDIPEGKEAHILPRSSTFKRYGILMANSQGVIDNTFGEEWKFIAYATTNVYIGAGTRICQFRLVDKMEPYDLQIIEELPSHKNRSGVGSSGV